MTDSWLRPYRPLAAVLLWASLWGGCTGATSASTGASVALASSTPAPSPYDAKLARFRVVYDAPKDQAYAKVAKALKESGAYDDLARQLTLTYKLPKDLIIRFTELGEENSYFNPKTNEIRVGYELVHAYSQIFEVDSNDPEAVEQEIIDAAFFTVLHEVGHALIANFELPVTGREEDAVDEFATLVLLEMGDWQSEAALISGIEQFSADAVDYKDISELPFSDEHSLDQQRFYDVMSIVYGSNPRRFADLLGGDYLPEERAESSEAEYEQKARSWGKLLNPHKR